MQHFLIKGRYLGSSPSKPGAHSISFLCDQCGTSWASIVIEGASWSFEFNRCEKHPDPSRQRLAGSLLRWPYCGERYLSPSNQALAIEGFPHEVLVREVLLHCNWLERKE